MVKKQMYSFYRSLFFPLIIIILSISTIAANSEDTFDTWLDSYKKYAQSKGVSKETISNVFKNVKYLDQVIKFDRRQPEFYEDTITYVSKRANASRVSKAKQLLRENKNLFNDVENKFFVEKEILLSLWGIETNFGKHVGKMDIISC